MQQQLPKLPYNTRLDNYIDACTAYLIASTMQVAACGAALLATGATQDSPTGLRIQDWSLFA